MVRVAAGGVMAAQRGAIHLAAVNGDHLDPTAGWMWFVVDVSDDTLLQGIGEKTVDAAKRAAERAARGYLENCLSKIPKDWLP